MSLSYRKQEHRKVRRVHEGVKEWLDNSCLDYGIIEKYYGVNAIMCRTKITIPSAEKVFYVLTSAHWTWLQGRAKLPRIDKDIDDAMHAIK